MDGTVYIMRFELPDFDFGATIIIQGSSQGAMTHASVPANFVLKQRTRNPMLRYGLQSVINHRFRYMATVCTM